MKPEDLAREYAHANWEEGENGIIAYRAFLAGFQSSQRELGLDEISKKALEVIEELVAEEDTADHDEFLCAIYRLAHAGRAIDCRKNHPGWTEEVLATWAKMNDAPEAKKEDCEK